MIALQEQQLDSKYEILGKIAEGGMGAVYKARHRLLDEVRVIKTLRPENADRESMRQRFQQEARTAIRLKHPGIAQLHDFTVAEDGTGFIILEFIDGVTLDRVLAGNGPLTPGAAARLGVQALEAIGYLHAQGFVHRDIAPDNLMLCRGFDGRPALKLIDLGIAKDLGGNSNLTQTGTFLGKIRYCSPEHFSESRSVDLRGDVYSFGLILYEMVTGQHPIPGETFTQMAAGHLFQPPLEFAESDPDDLVPEAFRQAVLKALEKNPDDRHASAAGLAEELVELELESAEIDQELDRVLESALTSRPGLESAGTTDRVQLDDQFRMGDASGSLDLGEAQLSMEIAKTVRRPPPTAPEDAAAATAGQRPAAAKSPVGLGIAAVLVLVGLATLWMMLRSSALDDRSAGGLDLRAEPSFRAELVAEASDDAGGVAIRPAVLAQIELPDEASAVNPPETESSQLAPADSSPPVVDQPPGNSEVAAGDSGAPSSVDGAGPVAEDAATVADADTTAPRFSVGLQVLALRKRVDELPRALDQTFSRPAMEPPEVSRVTVFDFDLQLDRDGTIVDIEPIGEPFDAAYAAALESVLYRTRFAPALRKGDPVKGHFRARIVVSP